METKKNFKMMRILKSFAVAFSMYSKIPMPNFKWNSEDMEYHLCFFPFVGAVIGALEYGWYRLAGFFSTGECVFALIAIAIPIVITGGFHLDGFMDTNDALHSYQSREKKLEILKDPHVGAFAVIYLVLYIILALAFMLMLKEDGILPLVGIFFMSRCISGLSVLNFKKAKKDGMLSTEAENSASKTVTVILIVEVILSLLYMMLISADYALAITVSQVLAFVYYRRMSEKEFGGITGDLAGFFVCISEITALFACVIVGMVR